MYPALCACVFCVSLCVCVRVGRLTPQHVRARTHSPPNVHFAVFCNSRKVAVGDGNEKKLGMKNSASFDTFVCKLVRAQARGVVAHCS